MAAQNRSQYREFSPPPSLSKQILCVWTQKIEEKDGPYCHSILPDGCVDIVWIGDMEPMVAGPATHRILAQLPAGTNVMGARFQPGWAGSFLGLPAEELLNQHVSLTEIAHPAARQLSQEVFNYRSESSRLTAIMETLESYLKKEPCIDPAIQACVTWLVRHPAGRISDLASQTGLSNRQIRRKFNAAVGYAPKTFQRIARFQRFLMLSEDGPLGVQDLAGLAYVAGYADQAHMGREVKLLSGDPPQVLLENNAVSTLAMFDLFDAQVTRQN
ncbi:transcriptional regulator, AraC family [Fodinibius roseus]|uniref:Transcriptional regulator, AraC family n=1 Tax=Fodinibius roseus TaxID=1194090 RepID=A0A1M4YUX2_9BACT|nr:AraC family transcriptional regulator [Fodinibius roseus]SHF09146.1 transcriptional regulator, AraC family [Fodinibius roseus]